MPTPEDHINILAPVAGGVFSAAVSMLFDIPPDALLVAFIGCWIGIAARPKEEGAVTQLPASLHWLHQKLPGGLIDFLSVAAIVVICTVATAYLVPLVMHFFPMLAQKTAAAVIGFVIVRFHTEILFHIRDFVARIFGRAG